MKKIKYYCKKTIKIIFTNQNSCDKKFFVTLVV